MATADNAASVPRPEDMTPEALFDLVHEYRNAPSNTASAMTGEQWAKAWQDEWQRANRAEVELEGLREANRLRDEQRKAASCSETGDALESGTEFVAHVCLDIEDGPRVFFQATDSEAVLRIVEEPRG